LLLERILIVDVELSQTLWALLQYVDFLHGHDFLLFGLGKETLESREAFIFSGKVRA
jgi:hypothetical protein